MLIEFVFKVGNILLTACSASKVESTRSPGNVSGMGLSWAAVIYSYSYVVLTIKLSGDKTLQIYTILL